MDAYREPDGAFWGAYGARIGVQLSGVVRKLRRDPWTRQAVIGLWDRELDGHLAYSGKLDYPCTVAIGFTLHPSFSSDALNMHVAMRSNDAWLGLPYDMFQFTQLHQTVCRLIDQRPGTYTHTAWSMHLYTRDVEASHAVKSDSPVDYFDPRGIGESFLSTADVIYRARTIALRPNEIHWDLTESERWYRDTIHGTPA